MDKKILLLPVTSDFIFKLIFGDQRNVDILAAFLRSVLDIPDDEYDRLVIVDPHIKKESQDDKYGNLDEVHKNRRRGGFRYAGNQKPANEKSGRRSKRTVG